MARPKAKALTPRELEVMHVFWDHGEQAATDVRDQLADQGRDLAYTTVATLVKILLDKGYLLQTSDQRPFRFKPAKRFEEVSRGIITDLVERVFGGSREQLLLRMFDGSKMTRDERRALQNILDEEKGEEEREEKK